MKYDRTEPRKVLRKFFVLLTLLGCTLVLSSESRARDPITCQNACFFTFIDCCGFVGGGGACTDCSQDYITCGAQCGSFHGKFCYNAAANRFDFCMQYGGDGCTPGDTECCYTDAQDTLEICMNP